MCKRYKIKVTGKVQGVWFRKYTKDKAKELNIKGVVQNKPDGSVYIEAESSDIENLKNMIEWLYIGSPLSKVKNVIIISKEDCLPYNNFDIIK